MIIIGVDYHPGFQQIAYVDTDTGEFAERRLAHREEAEQFYRDLAGRGISVRVGMEASGQARSFEAGLRLAQATPSTRAKWRSVPTPRTSPPKKCLTAPTLLERRFINHNRAGQKRELSRVRLRYRPL